jgi:hypothetical protein
VSHLNDDRERAGTERRSKWIRTWQLLIVVAELAIQEFISGSKHRNSVRQRMQAASRLSLIAQPTQSIVHYLFRLAHDVMEVQGALEALRIDLVDVFGTGGPSPEPAVSCQDF